jgi:hypothetical protein
LTHCLVPISVSVHRPVASGPSVPVGHVADSWVVVVTVHVGPVAGVLSGHVADSWVVVVTVHVGPVAGVLSGHVADSWVVVVTVHVGPVAGVLSGHVADSWVVVVTVHVGPVAGDPLGQDAGIVMAHRPLASGPIVDGGHVAGPSLHVLFGPVGLSVQSE